jgi:hypothetical protein
VITVSPLSTIPAVLVLHAPRPRPSRNSPPHWASWLRTLTNVTPARAGITAAALTVLNPKVLLVCAAAGLAIGTDVLGVAGTVTSAALFVAVAGSSVAIPVLACIGAGPHLDGPLERLKSWMEKNNAVLVAAILVLTGFVVLYKGIHAL